MNSVEAFKQSVRDWENVSHKWAKCGAADSEPDGVFQVSLAKAFSGYPLKIPNNAEAWDLYCSQPEAEKAASDLTAALSQCIDKLKAVNLADYRELKSFLEGYIWRTDLDYYN